MEIVLLVNRFSCAYFITRNYTGPIIDYYPKPPSFYVTSRHATLFPSSLAPLERQRTTAVQVKLFSQITTAGKIFKPFLTISFDFHLSFESTNL